MYLLGLGPTALHLEWSWFSVVVCLMQKGSLMSEDCGVRTSVYGVLLGITWVVIVSSNGMTSLASTE